MSRLGLAFRLFRRVLADPEVAARAEALLAGPAQGPDLRILALLQREGRLLDFLQEDIAGYGDAQIGAAVRDIHRGCRKVLAEYVQLEPIRPEAEEAPVTVPADFDPATVRLSGSVAGSPPYRGVLKHHGWRVTDARIPPIAAARDGAIVLAPAEVEIVG